MGRAHQCVGVAYLGMLGLEGFEVTYSLVTLLLQVHPLTGQFSVLRGHIGCLHYQLLTVCYGLLFLRFQPADLLCELCLTSGPQLTLSIKASERVCECVT